MMTQTCEKDRLPLFDAVAIGTGMVLRAIILALTGQIGEPVGPRFLLAFVAGAVVTPFSSNTCAKMRAINSQLTW